MIGLGGAERRLPTDATQGGHSPGPAPDAVPVAHPAPPSQPYGPGPAPYQSQPYTGMPVVPPPGGPHAPSDPAFVARPSPTATVAGPQDSLAEIPGSEFVGFLKISMRRAFRLRIEPSEVLPAERSSLERATPPIVDANLQAFLAWRRSVLFLVACALVPLAVVGITDALRSTQWRAIFFVKFVPAFAELLFLLICWSQLKRWASWRTQRRKLFWGWLLFMLSPFIVFVYPLETIVSDIKRMEGAGGVRDFLAHYGVSGAYKRAIEPFVFSMIAMLQLAPKAISLMPGLIRSSLVIKLLFPGVSSPGWLIVMASPMYALLAYVILIIPYQFTGSGYFVAGILGVVAAQAVLARSGFQLARPQTEAEAFAHIKRVRLYYMIVMWISAVLIVVALGSLVSRLKMSWADVVLAVLKFESNVLILTMIGADLVITNLDKARQYTHGRDAVEDATEHKIAAFVGFQAPPGPPR